jgi:hypothetical protein
MTIAVIALVSVLVFVMLGYRYNGGDGKIEQGGLVQFDSQPNGANITIDSAPFGTRTPSKTTLSSGGHAITIGRSGYDTWQKTVNVAPGAVLWLNYARLIPQHLSPEGVANFTSVSDTLAAPDNNLIAIEQTAAAPDIQLADISGDSTKMSTLTIPSDAYTAPAAGSEQSFTLASWDANSRYILVEHNYGGDRIEWLIVDTRDASATKNVTKLLDIKASKVVFSGNNSQILYAQVGTDVRKIDLSAATMSRPLASNVAEFSIFDQTTIVFTTAYDATAQTRSVEYYKDGDQSPNIIRTFQDDGSAPLHVALGRYFSSMYEVIAYGNTVTVLAGALPTSTSEAAKLQQVATIPFSGGVQYLSVMTEGRFVVAQNADTYKTYDLELKKSTSTVLKGTTAVTRQLGWIDGYMLWSDRDGMVRLYEFDGANQHDIMKVVSGYDVTLGPNDKYLYGINKTGTTYQLERVQLILP